MDGHFPLITTKADYAVHATIPLRKHFVQLRRSLRHHLSLFHTPPGDENVLSKAQFLNQILLCVNFDLR